MHRDIHLKELRRQLRRLWSLKWLALVPAVIGFAVAATFAILQRDIYRGEATMVAEFSTPTGGSVRRSEVERTKEVLRSVQERVYSDTFILPMIKELGLYPKLTAANRWDRAEELVRENLTVTVEGSKGVVKVQFDYDRGDNAAELAAKGANHTSKHLVNEARSSIKNESDNMREFWQREAEDAERRVRSLRNELMKFQLEHAGALPGDRKSNQDLIDGERRAMDLLSLKEDGARLQIASTQADLEYAERALREARIAAGADSELEPRREELKKLRVDLAALERSRTPKSDKVKQLRARIVELEGQIKTLETQGVENASDDDLSVQYELNRVQRYEASIKRWQDELKGVAEATQRCTKKIEDAEMRLAQSYQIEASHTKLVEDLGDAEREWDTARKAHDEAQQTVRFHTRTDEFALHATQVARPPSKPVGPKRLIMSLIGLLAGLGIGAGVAIARIRLDTSIRSREDLKPLLPSSILVAIPDLSGPARRTWSVFGHAVLGACLVAIFAVTVGALCVREGWMEAPEAARPIIEGLQRWLPRM